MQTIQQKLPPPPPFTAVLMMSPTLSCVQVNRYKTRILTIEIFFLSFNKIYSEFQNIFFFCHMEQFFFQEITFIFINSLAG